MKKLKAIVLGVGHLGKEHARIYFEHTGVDLVGVIDPEEDRCHQIAEKYKTKKFLSFDEVDIDFDIATVAVPTKDHFTLSKKLLQKNKHILVEKPITETLDQANELVALREGSNLILQVGHVERFNPATQVLFSILKRPQFIESHRLSTFPYRGTDVGVVLDLMIHDIDIILQLTQSPIKDISAVGVKVLSSYEDIANARLEFQNGCIANITTSRVAPEAMRKIRIFQENTYISLDYHKQEAKVYRKDKDQIRCEDLPIAKEEPLKLEVDAFVNSVGHALEPQVSGEHGRYALEIAFEILHLIDERQDHV